MVSKKLDFDKNFILATYGLRLFGAHPSQPKDFYWLVKFTIIHGVFFTSQTALIVYSIFAHDLKEDFTNACANTSLIMGYLIVSMFYFVMVRHQPSLVMMMDTMKRHYAEAHTLPEEQQKVIKKFAQNGKFVTKFWLVLTANCSLGFIFLPLLTMAYTAFIDDFKYNPVVELTFPKIFYEINENTLFVLHYILGTIFFTYAAFMYCSVMPLGPIFILHACGQLEILEIKLNQLFSNNENLTKSERSERIKIIAVTLQEVFEFVDQIQKSFRLLYELLLKGSSIVLPFLLFQVLRALQNEEGFRMQFFILLVSCIPVSSCPCYYGEILVEKSDEFGETIYTCGWETEYDKKGQRSLLLMLTRMQKPTAIKSIFRTINRETLTDVFHSAYAIFSLLLAAGGVN